MLSSGEGSGNASKENSNDNTPQQNEETNNKKEETTNKSDDKAEVNQTNDDNQQRVNATPYARRYARENGVNLC